MDETVANIKKYLAIINPHTSNGDIDEKLIDFVIRETIDRVLLYLNTDKIQSNLERVLANIVATGLVRCLKSISVSDSDLTGVDRVVTSMSDNGQSITYANEVTNYFTTASDNELFTGFSSLLSRYRMVKVVHSKTDED